MRDLDFLHQVRRLARSQEKDGTWENTRNMYYQRDRSVRCGLRSMLAQHVRAKCIPLGGKWALMTRCPLAVNYKSTTGIKSRSEETRMATSQASSQARLIISVTIAVSIPFSTVLTIRPPQ